MKISFIIPAYNEKLYLPKCLASVFKMAAKAGLKQGKDFEIIVVDNASTDGTAQVAQNFKGVKVVRENRKSLTFARQAGFENSNGELIANIDADTILTENWIEFVLKEFRNKNLAGLSGPQIFYELGRITNLGIKFFYKMGMLSYHLSRFFKFGSLLQGGNCVVRRSALEKIGGFNRDIAFYGEDTDLARRLSKVGDVRFTLKMPIYASARRIQQEGRLTMAMRYALNYLSMLLLNKPFTKDFIDVRRAVAEKKR